MNNSLNIKEILGTDNISASRFTINENFKVIENLLVNINSLVDTSSSGGAISVSKININSVNDDTLVCKGGVNFKKTLNIDGELTVNSKSTLKNLDVTGDININPTLASDIKIGTLQNKVNINHINGMSIDERFSKESESITSVTTSINIEGKYLIKLDCSTIPSDASSIITFTGTPVTGQKLYIYIPTPATGNCTYIFPNIAKLTGTQDQVRKSWLEIIYVDGNWRVISMGNNINIG